MDQAALLVGLPFDAMAFEQDSVAATVVDIGWGEVLQALVGAVVVLLLYNGRDLRLQVAGQVVVLEQDAVLQGPMSPLDLALGLRIARRTAEMVHCIPGQLLCQFAGDVAGPDVGQQARAVPQAALRGA
ncbi:hypothetical protein GWK15_25010 [Roseomonas oryzicola]|uniref:Uncharacterized protein n=1 Tax=Neoroseomonas oryzicola TaxID=535904 RepID=A0A9X9WP76_9PROT|nr:hypothetical protein [Neoroseomonas oryzicola]NKE20239.1 hypothetical protein [Neoroseomonas oryzicola]